VPLADEISFCYSCFFSPNQDVNLDYQGGGESSCVSIQLGVFHSWVDGKMKVGFFGKGGLGGGELFLGVGGGGEDLGQAGSGVGGGVGSGFFFFFSVPSWRGG